jgi:hypothetical protein
MLVAERQSLKRNKIKLASHSSTKKLRVSSLFLPQSSRTVAFHFFILQKYGACSLVEKRYYTLVWITRNITIKIEDHIFSMTNERKKKVNPRKHILPLC